MSHLPARKPHLDTLAVGILLGCCLFWGLQQVLVKLAMAEIAPVYQAALRFIGALVLLVAWARWRGQPLWPAPGARMPALLAGALFTGEFICIYLGLQWGSASRLTLFLYTSPFWVAGLLSLLLPSERLRPVQWAGLLCAFGAVAMALNSRSGSAAAASGEHASALGDWLGLLAGLMWGLTTVTIRTTPLARASATQMLFCQVLFSAVSLPLVSLAMGEVWTVGWGALATTSLLLQTGVGAFASYLAWMWLLGRYAATQISVFVFLTPVFAMGFAALWLGEPITATLVAALALVALGIVLVNRRA